MAKTKIQMQDVADILANVQEPFQAPAMLTSGTAHNAITVTDLSGNKRQIQDPSKTLRPAMGIERISTKSIKLSKDEKGPNGERVWKSTDDRVRFVGNSWNNSSDTNGQYPNSSNLGDYVEVTFYGTGINLLGFSSSFARTWQVAINGSNTITVSTTASNSNVLTARNYNQNVPFNLATNLTLGVYTLKLSITVGDMRTFGFEVLNEASTIKVPSGRILSNGRSASINALQSLAYSSDFEGSPILNGRGGRVLVYSDGSQIKKAIQQVDAVPLYLSFADHSNEEVIRRINFREFGANRSDDFTTLVGSISDRSFTLEDGTTILTGDDTYVTTHSASGIEGLRVDANPDNYVLTFVGTGLDIFGFAESGSTGTQNHNVSIDGAADITFSETISSGTQNFPHIVKICSGLPYGTHKVRIQRTSGSTQVFATNDFIIYGPKKPSIPADSLELGEYYLMANFVAGTTADINTIATGTLRKSNNREMTYVGTWSTALNVSSVVGQDMTTTTTGDYVQYTFFGTGFEYRWHNNAVSATWQFTIDGSTNLSGFTTSFYGAGVTSFTPSTGTLVGSATGTSGNGIAISGLTLGLHTVRFTKTAGTGIINTQSFDIITPIHYPNNKLGSLALKSSIEVKELAKESNIDLSKAKAWAVWDGINNIILESYNISAMFRSTTGEYNFYFEKPFKNNNYVIAYQGTNAQSFLNNFPTHNTASKCQITTTNTTGGIGNTEHSSVIFFGELAEEGNE